MPLVSVVIPCYNSEMYIKQCISSILDYDSNVEVLCIDDNSTDRTFACIQQMALVDSRILLIKNVKDHNIYGGSCRNIGLSLARGKYVYFCDSDDYTLPSLISECLDKCECLNADICCFKHKRIDAKTGKLDPKEYGLNFDFLYNDLTTYNCNSSKNVFIASGTEVWDKFYRKSFLDKINAQFQQLKNSNDNAFHVLTMAKAHRIAVLDKVLYMYRSGTKTSVIADFAKGNNIMDFIKAIQQAKKYVLSCNSIDLQRQFSEWIEHKARFVISKCERLSEEFICAFKDFANNLAFDINGIQDIIECMKAKVHI